MPQAYPADRPRILMISVRADHGGGPAHMFLLSKKLVSQFDIYVALPQEEPYWCRFAELIGVDNLLPIPHRKFRIDSFSSLCSWVKTREIGLIHSHGKGAGIYGRLAGLLAGVPVVHTFHGVHIGQYGKIGRVLYLGLERILGRFTRTIIAVSPSERNQMLSLKLAKPARIMVVENGIEIPDEHPEMRLLSPPYSIATITRFDYAKNPELLAEIILRLSKITPKGRFVFDVIGDGEGRENFERPVAGEIAGKTVTMHGFKDNPYPILQRAWLYLSTSRWESFGLAAAEALVRGIPVLATDVTGSRDLVENGKNGWLFPVDKPDEAVNIILRLSDDTKSYRTISKTALTNARERFSADRMAQATAEIYRTQLERC